ncbi:MAG TPA: TonB-dependent receptor [Burkholderiaceae bacterium]
MSFKLKALPLALAQVIAGGALTMAIAPVFAQSTDTSQPAVQRVEVTGSSIRRADAETPSPVQVITSEELKQSGYTTIAQVLNNITANGQGTLSQGFTGAFAAGGQAISLRGLNSSATLVLIDGHRVAPNAMFDDGQRSFVDIGAIPFDAIERVEVLKDGASAQYGSDAMAGVVNVILKKNFTGTTVNVEGGGATEGGDATKHLSLTTGFGNLDSDGYNSFLSVEYRHTNPISLASRYGDGAWTNLNFTGVGGQSFVPGVVNSNNPTPKVPGSIYLYNPNGSPTDPASYSFVSGPCNSYAMLSSGGCAYKPIGDLVGETSNFNIMGSFTKKLSGDWLLDVKASMFESNVAVVAGGFGQGAQVAYPGFIQPSVGVNPAVGPFVVGYPQNYSSGTITVPANYPGNTLGVPAQVIGYDPSSPYPQTDVNSKNYRLAFDLTGSIGDWDTSTSVNFTRNTLFENSIGGVQSETLALALNRASNPYNILGGNTPTDINAIYPANSVTMHSDLDTIEFHATRSLMQLAGGDLGFSAGASYTYMKIDSPPLPLNAAAALPSSSNMQFVEGSQSDTAVYAEIAAPVTKALELDAHARYDRFGLSGQNNSFTPSVGFKWTPTDVFAMRGTLATGFRAPNVAETGHSGLTFAGGNDTQLCPNGPANGVPVPSCLPTAIYETGAQSHLNPEKSTSATLGMILEPVKGWSTTFDMYDIKIKDQIYTPPPSVSLTDVRSQTPVSTTCYTNGGASSAPCTVPGGANGLLLYIVDPYENTNSTEVRGWELETHYKWKMGEWGTLFTGLDWTHEMSYILNVGGTAYQLAGTHGPELIGGDTANPKDRVQATITYDKGPWDITAVENYISSYTNTDPSYVGGLGLANTCANNLSSYSGFQFSGYAAGMSSFPSSFCKTDAFYTTDVTVRYKYNKQLVMHFAVNNLFNRQPPFDAGTYGGSPYQYNPSMHMAGAIGRFIQGGLTYSF